MGRVTVSVKMTNAIDVGIAERKLISKSEIRSLEVEGIVDTGAAMLSLPEDLVEQLGLRIMGHRRVRYANGKPDRIPFAGVLLLEIQGRETSADCLVQKKGSPVLIGQIPLEAMDWAVHPAGQRLIPGHEGEDDMAMIEMY